MFNALSNWYDRHHLCHTWLGKKLSDCHQLISNLYVGLLITLLLVFTPIHNLPLITIIEDFAIDWVINAQLHTPLTKPETTHFTFLNLDDRTYQNWGEPLITPRDKLQQLIKFALAGQPKVIVVDIDLTYPTRCVTERTHCAKDLTQLNDADTELKTFLKNYEESNPYLILVKTTQPILDTHGKPTAQRQWRPSFLDEVVENNERIYWASTLFELEDNRLRRWRLCEAGKTTENPLPSVQLLINNLLNPEAKLSCTSEDEDLSQRILYALRPTSEQVPYPAVTVSKDGTQRPLLTNYPAYQLIEHPEADKSALQHSITIIGSSYLESNDLYTTPLGTMPGALIIVNAIHSLQQYGILEKPHGLIAILIEIVLIMVMSYLFTHFNSFYGMLLSGLFVMIIIIPLSFWLFKYGTWLDFVIPLFAVQLHQMASVFHHKKEVEHVS